MIESSLSLFSFIYGINIYIVKEIFTTDEDQSPETGKTLSRFLELLNVTYLTNGTSYK